MKYYAVLLLGLIGIIVPLNIAFSISEFYGNYLYGFLFLSAIALIVWMIYKRWAHEKGAFSAMISSLTAILIVDLGMIYAVITGLHPG